VNKLGLSIALLALTACQTCNRHPVVCGTAIFVGTAAATLVLHNHSSARSHDVTTQPVNCSGSACL
jgi:hypothetical protein